MAEVAARAVDPDSETEASKQAFRKMKEEINLISSDEEAAPVAAVGDGKKRAGARPHVHVAMGVRVEAPRAAPSQHAPRVERGAWRPEQRLSWSAEGQCEGSTAPKYCFRVSAAGRFHLGITKSGPGSQSVLCRAAAACCPPFRCCLRLGPSRRQRDGPTQGCSQATLLALRSAGGMIVLSCTWRTVSMSTGAWDSARWV